MGDVEPFAWIVLAVAVVGIGAVLSSRISAWLRIPAPLIFLVCAAVASDLVPSLDTLSTDTVQRLVTVALVVILFDGGMHIGWRRFRSAASAVAWVGVLGTLVTAGAVAGLAHLVLGLAWFPALLLGTALAPTDPAVVFSVLGRREIEGRTGTILEGESGANDPVGIALLVSLVTAGTGTGGDPLGSVVTTFAEQMAVGAVVGVAGGYVLLLFSRRVPLPHEGLYALRTLAAALVVYGLATVAHGSGFLAVFVAGILMGDANAPFKADIRRFHSSLASIAEIVVFVVLGLTVSVRDVIDGGVWWLGLVLAVLLTFVVRPVLVGLLLVPIRLRWGERAFVTWAGLKGAVPILLGTFVISSGIAEAQRIYGLIFVVVAFSILVQGGLVPFVADRCRVPMRVVDPLPWTLGVRFRTPPHGVRRVRVVAGSVADGATVAELPLGEDAWISLVLRESQSVHVRGSTRLAAGDEIVLLVDSPEEAGPDELFTQPA
ncbi:MAG TPA: potassium/proton antiporter [Pseudonocardiaceae bacterium]|nr:potassium/proton antiporter [Pseudonocardiaceae bacterium]